jgi:hypothetical protein
VYLGDYLKKELGWDKTKTTKRTNTKESPKPQVIPNSHGIITRGDRIFVVYIHPMKEWKTVDKAKIHWMNTEHMDYKTATYKYTYEDVRDPNKDNNELWKKDRKEYKR